MDTSTPTAPPTALDRFANWISPKWGMQRQAWRTMQASYKGGVSHRLSESWGSQQGLRFDDAGQRGMLANGRNRGYEAYDNNAIAKTLADVEAENVIGDGLNFHPTSSSPEWNKEAKDRYYRWLDECDLTGSRSGADLQRTIWTLSRVAGDIGWILVADGDESRIQLVPAENIATPDGKYQDDIYDGIRFDRVGRATEFYVLSADERGQREFKPIAARDFVFLPHFTKTNQGRGVTCYMTIFEELAEFDKYRGGVATAAWLGTIFGLVIKQENAGRTVAGLDTVLGSQGDQRRAVYYEKGMVKYVGTKDEVAQVQSYQPMQQAPDFMTQMLRLIGMPFGMPLEVFVKDMARCNFASARIGLLPFYRLCRTHATTRFGPRWSRTIRWWLSREANRAPGDPKRWTNAFPSDYWNHNLLPNEWDYTDPVSDVKGRALECAFGFDAISNVISESGKDPDEVHRLREEYAAKTKANPPALPTETRDVVDPDRADKDFKQKFILSQSTHRAQAAVFYNATNVPDTMTDAGLELDPEVDIQKGDIIPFVPVEDDSGNLVTGETIEDSEGDIVGGDIDAPPTVDGAIAGTSGGAAKEAADKESADKAAEAVAQQREHERALAKLSKPEINLSFPPTSVVVNTPEQKPAAVIVNVEPTPLKITNSPAEVTVNVPEQKPADVRVTVESPPPAVVNVRAENTINVPEQSAPVVNVKAPQVTVENTVNVPQQATPKVKIPPPVVQVIQQPRGAVRKTLVRDSEKTITGSIEEPL